MTPTDLDRRTFLARLGVLGAVAGGGLLLPSGALAAPPATTLAADPILDLVRQLIEALKKDTFQAVAAFVAPGSDPHSLAQGTPRIEPGGLAARTPDFLISFFDNYVGLPDELLRGLANLLAGGLAQVPVQLPNLPTVPPADLAALDGAIRRLLTGPDALPLATVIALLLNVVAVQVNPLSVIGPFASPFARLSFQHKAIVFSVLEQPDSPILAALLSPLGPLADTIASLVRFLTGSLLEMAAFGTYSEWAVFDPATLGVRSRPVGWAISRYDPGVLHGWNDFRGYYQGRCEVDA